uniref:Uncharacterized protein n=1 Tax=Rhizophora mucronata TaxID=61149 RepID=A0A2P2ML80_RHIMU
MVGRTHQEGLVSEMTILGTVATSVVVVAVAEMRMRTSVDPQIKFRELPDGIEKVIGGIIRMGEEEVLGRLAPKLKVGRTRPLLFSAFFFFFKKKKLLLIFVQLVSR